MRRYLIYFPLLFLMVSCEIIEEDISGRAVTTIAPADDAEVPAGETLFRWRAVDRATGYELCVATEGRIVADTLLAADTLGLARSYGCRLRLEAGRYEWTVAAFNSGYETSSLHCGSRSPRNPCPRSRRSRTIPNPPNREIALDDLSAARSRRGCLGRRGVADPRAGTTLRAGCPTRDRHPAAPQIVAETLRLDYPDPFLKGVAAPTPAARSVVRRLPPAGKAKPKRRERVQLSHLATVTAGGQALHILTIGGRQYELSLRDTAAGFRLTGADRDSLYLEREGTVYGVKRCDE